MTTCVIHLTPVAGSMQASARVARFLADTLKLPLIDGIQTLAKFVRELPKAKERDITLLFINGPIAFCGYRDEIGGLLLPRVRRVVWVQQDYTITLPPNQAYSRPTKAETPFRAEFHSIPEVCLWSTCQDVLARRQAKQVPGCAGDEYVNWNALTYAPTGAAPKPENPGLLYYGALRQDRAGAFSLFFGDPEVAANTTISVSNFTQPVLDKWRKLVHRDVTLETPFKRPAVYRATNGNQWGEQALVEDVARYQHALYIADATSNTAFHSLANRFYEALSTPYTVLWLDAAGATTYWAAGLRDWENYAVSNGAELAANMRLTTRKLASLAARQRADWLATDPFKDLQAKVKQLGRTS